MWEWVLKLDNDNENDEISTLGMITSPPPGSYDSSGGGSYVIRSFNGCFYQDGSSTSSRNECKMHPGYFARFVYDGGDSSLRFWRRPEEQGSDWQPHSNPSPADLEKEGWEGGESGILLCKGVPDGRTYYPGGMSYSSGVEVSIQRVRRLDFNPHIEACKPGAAKVSSGDDGEAAKDRFPKARAALKEHQLAMEKVPASVRALNAELASSAASALADSLQSAAVCQALLDPEGDSGLRSGIARAAAQLVPNCGGLIDEDLATKRLQLLVDASIEHDRKQQLASRARDQAMEFLAAKGLKLSDKEQGGKSSQSASSADTKPKESAAASEEVIVSSTPQSDAAAAAMAAALMPWRSAGDFSPSYADPEDGEPLRAASRSIPRQASSGRK